jgi:hypothetical protein
MAIYKEPVLRAAHKHSIYHREEILESFQCSCFYCLSVFPPSAIAEWIDGRSVPVSPSNTTIVTVMYQTAICPFCGTDSVLGEKSNFPINDDAFLREMNQYWF